MTRMKHVVTLPYLSNIPQDVAQNTFFTSGTASAAGMGLAFATRLGGFYNTIPSGGSAKITTYLSSYIDFTKVTVKSYDLDEPEPRPPVVITPLTWTGNTSGNAPSEVSMCLSFQGDAVPGQSQARRRGRVYIGPLALTVTTSGSNQPCRPLTATRNTIALAGKALQALNDSSCTWCVYSTVTGDLVPVTNGWVDDEFDTQRRRGLRSTTRTLFP